MNPDMGQSENSLFSPDFPAAHSMDTTWFAVDAVGHVAMFDTGENGHVPHDASDAVSLYELERMYWPNADDDEYRPPQDLAERLGIFLFDFPEQLVEIVPAYERVNVPLRPMHIDQLPPAIRDVVKHIRFPGRFHQIPRVQPIEQGRCQFWYDGDSCYEMADGKTVRAFPGKEAEFAQFVRELRQSDPDTAARYAFEGIDGGH